MFIPHIEASFDKSGGEYTVGIDPVVKGINLLMAMRAFRHFSSPQIDHIC